MSTGFARDYIMHAEMCSKDGKITGLRVDVIADHGAFDSTAQPTKFPAGFFHIVLRLLRPRGRPRAGQGRLHEQGAGRRRLPLLVPDHRGRVPGRADGRRARARDGRRPDRPADAQLHRARAVPVRDDHRLDVRLRQLRRRRCARRCEIAGYDELRKRAGREARPRRADGHRRVVLHRGRRRRPAQAHGHPRAGDERRRRPARAPVGQGGGQHLARRPRARATRRRSRRSSPRSSGSRPRTSRSATATPTGRRTGSAPTAPARRRCPARRWRSSRARCATGRA